MPVHRRPGKSRSPRKSRRRAPLTAVMCLALGAAYGGYALAGGSGPETVGLSSATGTSASSQDVTIYGCLRSGKLGHVSVTGAPKCPVTSTPVDWAVPSQSVGVAGQSVTVYACLALGRPLHLSVASSMKCSASSVPAHYSARFGSTVLAGQQVTVDACLALGTLTRVTVAGTLRCPASTIPAHWPALFTPPPPPDPAAGSSALASTPSSVSAD